MKIATLIRRLEEVQQRHGDVEVGIRLDIDEVSPRIRIEPEVIDMEVRHGDIQPCLVLHPADWE
ncbi:MULTISPECIES: hypothetical protein [Zymobacter]|nr:hypothetical protein [Zymobacter palmae]